MNLPTVLISVLSAAVCSEVTPSPALPSHYHDQLRVFNEALRKVKNGLLVGPLGPEGLLALETLDHTRFQFDYYCSQEMGGQDEEEVCRVESELRAAVRDLIGQARAVGTHDDDMQPRLRNPSVYA